MLTLGIVIVAVILAFAGGVVTGHAWAAYEAAHRDPPRRS